MRVVVFWTICPLSLGREKKALLIFTKTDLQFPKPYQIVKSEKYETFCVSKLLIWHQKWVASVWHGNSLEIRQVSPGRVIVVLF